MEGPDDLAAELDQAAVRELVCSTRPPGRLRASSTTTSDPVARQSRAAERPASPAPRTVVLLRAASARLGDRSIILELLLDPPHPFRPITHGLFQAPQPPRPPRTRQAHTRPLATLLKRDREPRYCGPMPIVETVRGPVELDDLGRTLMHEHVFLLEPGGAGELRHAVGRAVLG